VPFRPTTPNGPITPKTITPRISIARAIFINCAGDRRGAA
jgi:hypothetical protein